MPAIEKASKTGFCFGVRRAINRLEKVASERDGVETGAGEDHLDQAEESPGGRVVAHHSRGVVGEVEMVPQPAAEPSERVGRGGGDGDVGAHGWLIRSTAPSLIRPDGFGQARTQPH